MKSPTNSSATVSTASSSERIGRRPPLVSVATERIRWRACSMSWLRSGRRTVQLLAVTDPGRRDDDDAGAAEVGPPAQVDVVAVEGDGAVEPAEGAEQVGPHQEARRRQHEHVADGVVLLLVVLPRLGDRVDLAEAVEAEADVLEDARIVPRHELGADETGVGAVQLLDQEPDGVGLEGDVVVADAEEAVVALDEAEHLVGGDAEPGVGAQRAHEGVRQARRDQRGEVGAIGVDGVAGEQEERVEVRVVLVDERFERLLEPGTGTVDDDDGDDRRRERGVGLHGAARLSPTLGAAGTVTRAVGGPRTAPSSRSALGVSGRSRPRLPRRPPTGRALACNESRPLQETRLAPRSCHPTRGERELSTAMSPAAQEKSPAAPGNEPTPSPRLQ